MRTARARISGEQRFDVLLFSIALILSQIEGLQQTRGGSHIILTDNGIQFVEQPRNRNTIYS